MAVQAAHIMHFQKKKKKTMEVLLVQSFPMGEHITSLCISLALKDCILNNKKIKCF